MKVVPRIGTGDNHDKKIAPVIKVTIAHRGLEEMAIFFNPILQVDRWLHGDRCAGRERCFCGGADISDEAGYLLPVAASNEWKTGP